MTDDTTDDEVWVDAPDDADYGAGMVWETLTTAPAGLPEYLDRLHTELAETRAMLDAALVNGSELAAELADLRGKIARVAALHPDPNPDGMPDCPGCDYDSPCPTVRALTGGES